METFEARVVAAYGRKCLIETPDGQRMRAVARGRADTPVCNDRVRCSRNDAVASVEAVLDRRRVFWRYDRGGGKRALASDIDLLCIVLAAEPAADAALLDRYIASAEINGIGILLIWTKTDMQPLDATLLSVYRRLGYEVVEVSSETGAGFKELGERIAGKTALLTGLSGVGKSSLINRLIPDAEARTSALSDASGEGTHTTTNATAYMLNGNLIVDTPGVRDYYLWPMPAAELVAGFKEIADAAGGCRFRNCSHQNEPGCAVIEAVAEDRIDAQRHARFVRLAKGLARQLEQRSY